MPTNRVQESARRSAKERDAGRQIESRSAQPRPQTAGQPTPASHSRMQAEVAQGPSFAEPFSDASPQVANAAEVTGEGASWQHDGLHLATLPSGERGREGKEDPASALLSTLESHSAPAGTDGHKRKKGLLARVAATLRMALGQDDSDDYECGKG
jgi:hypothetical protein